MSASYRRSAAYTGFHFRCAWLALRQTSLVNSLFPTSGEGRLIGRDQLWREVGYIWCGLDYCCKEQRHLSSEIGACNEPDSGEMIIHQRCCRMLLGLLLYVQQFYIYLGSRSLIPRFRCFLSTSPVRFRFRTTLALYPLHRALEGIPTRHHAFPRRPQRPSRPRLSRRRYKRSLQRTWC